MEYANCSSKHHEGERLIAIELFSKDKNRKSGLHNHCKVCRRKAQTNWYQANAAEIAQRVSTRYFERSTDETRAVQNDRAKRYKEKRGIPWALLMSVQTRARKRNLECDLTESDLTIPDVCPILGIPLDQTVGPRTNNYPTVDRLDNSKGYTKDNISIISWRANNLKGTATLEELILLGKFAQSHI